MKKSLIKLFHSLGRRHAVKGMPKREGITQIPDIITAQGRGAAAYTTLREAGLTDDALAKLINSEQDIIRLLNKVESMRNQIMRNQIKSPVLPSAPIIPMRSGIGTIRGRGFPSLQEEMKDQIRRGGRKLGSKAAEADIDKLGYVRGGQYKSMLPEPGPGDAQFVKDAMAMETGISRAIARNLLLKDTRLKLKPEELFMLKEGKGEPLELMRKYYGESMLKYDDFLNQVNIHAARPDEFAEMVLKYVKLIPQFAEGGLAEILQAPRSGMRIGGLGLLTRGLRTALKRTKKGYDVPGADFQVLMDNASYLMSPVNMQKIKKLELYRKQLVRDILRKEGGGKFMHGPQPEATRADLQLLDDYIAQLKNKIKEVGYYGEGAAKEKALLASRPDLPFSKFVKDKSRHAHGGLARILEV